MENKVSATSRACVVIAASAFAFVWASVSAAELAGPSTAEFQVLANSDLLVLGPVDLAEPSKAQVQILGQWIPVSKSQIPQGVEGLVGHVLAVYGSVATDGSLEVATVREQDSVSYVPGAIHLYIKASISALDSTHGTARIGSLSVSYTNALHTLVAEDLSVGAVVSFSGLQFAGNNELYADNGLVHNASNTVDTKALGQTGSGFNALGQTGSGVKALGQSGSGLSALGQTGSGVKALGQTGSGVKALGQTGSGLSALGQTGSGVKALGQTGSGVKALGQTGSGLSALGQTGSGVKALGQTGSGVKALGQTWQGRSGVKALGQTAARTGSAVHSAHWAKPEAVSRRWVKQVAA